MQDDLPTFNEGSNLVSQLTARNLNKIVSAIRRFHPLSSPSVRTTETPNGTALEIVPPKIKSALATQHSFKLVVASEGGAKVNVIYGTVNNFVPKIGGISLFTTPAPILTVVSGSVYLDATVDSAGTITDIVIANAATTPVDTTTHKYRIIGTVTVTSGEVTAMAQSVRASLTFYLCNNQAIWES